jgi:hypothetical protein
MRNLKVYTVYDHAAEAYLEPFFLPTRGTAIRSFAQAVNQDGHSFNQHPDDYTLYEIGEFDPSRGTVTGTEHVSLGNAVEFLNRPRIVPSDVAEA